MEQLALTLLGAVVGVVLTLALTEPRRRRERREDEDRHRAELAAAKADVQSEGAQERQIDALVQTRRMLAAMLADLGATAAGEGATRPGRYGADAYPRANVALVGDGDALAAYFMVVADLAGRKPGSGLHISDGRAMAGVEGRISVALEAQEERTLAGEPLRTVTAAELAATGPTLQAALAQIEGRPHDAPPAR